MVYYTTIGVLLALPWGLVGIILLGSALGHWLERCQWC